MRTGMVSIGHDHSTERAAHFGVLNLAKLMKDSNRNDKDRYDLPIRSRGLDNLEHTFIANVIGDYPNCPGIQFSKS